MPYESRNSEESVVSLIVWILVTYRENPYNR